jgi:ribose transport system substrate-binding protein
MTLTTRSTGLRSKVAVSAAAAAVLLLAACGSSSSGTTSSSAAAGSSTPAASSSSAAADPIAAVQAELDALKAPVAWPAPTAPSKPLDIKGKTVWWIPIGDAVPVIHGIGEGFKQAVEAAGGTFKLCDGKFNPAEVGNCLKQSGEQGAGAVVTAFIDYAMLPNAFDALTGQGIPVLVGGVPASGDATVGPKLGFFDPTERVNGIYDVITKSGLAKSGTDTNGLWLRLLDSSTTTNASDAGIATYKEICPTCALATVDFTTANIDKLASAVSAALVKNPDINTLFVPVDSFVPPAVQGAKTAGKSDLVVVSASGDLANLQAVKAGTQAGDFGNPVIYTGWTYANALGQLLAGDAVTPDDKAVGRYFDSSNIGDLTLTPEEYLTSNWYGDEAFKATFLAAWGVK